MPKLGVNIDHVATLRQARRQLEPDPLEAVQICEEAGASSIVAHLREDRRHINDHDVKRLRRVIKSRFNLEMSLNPRIVEAALYFKPDQATLVPEKRQEITTEGGLDVAAHFERIRKVIRILNNKGITVSLFIDPDQKQIKKAQEAGVTMIELHTGRYANAKTESARKRELKKLKEMTASARHLGLTVNAGHGLNYHNTQAVAEIEGIEELNIGHAIISRAVFVGLKEAVREMVRLMSLAA